MATETVSYSYIGVAPCGCVRAAVVDNPTHAKDVRKAVGEFMRWGATIERVTVQQVRDQFCTTTHPKKEGCPHPGACPNRLAAPADGGEGA